LKKIVSIFGWIILILAFASLGLTSDDPTFGFFFYLAFFLIVFGLVYKYIKKNQRRKESNPKTMALIRKILGIVLLIISLFSPIIALRKIQLPFMPNLLILIVTAVLIAIGTGAVILINKDKILKLLGLILLILLSAIPAIFATTYLGQYFPNAYNALGTAYWAIISVSIFSWWGFSLYFSKN
jgi:cytochrome c oxidase assembly factor CtaG